MAQLVRPPLFLQPHPSQEELREKSPEQSNLPMQAQGMQKGWQTLHDEQDGYSQHCKNSKDDEDNNEAYIAAVV